MAGNVGPVRQVPVDGPVHASHAPGALIDEVDRSPGQQREPFEAHTWTPEKAALILGKKQRRWYILLGEPLLRHRLQISPVFPGVQ